MKSEAVTAFWRVAAKDAAVQEQLVEAAKRPDPMAAIIALGATSGFEFTVDELTASMTSELTEEELDSVAGGADAQQLIAKRFASLHSCGEWFAESYT